MGVVDQFLLIAVGLALSIFAFSERPAEPGLALGRP